jgi:hypothetical protein
MTDGYQDDATILDDHALLRRIPPQHLVPDHNTRRIRISSAAFEDDRDGDPMSILLAETLRDLGQSPDAALAGHPDFGLASLTARLVREKGQIVVRRPEEGDPAHGLVVGHKPASVRKAFARAAKWAVPPPGKVLLGLDRIPVEWTQNVREEDAARVLLVDGT